MKLERKPVRGAIIATVITLLGGFLYFYFALPALNIHNLDAYVFLAVLIIASDMYDNRGATVKEANSNKTLECILGMYSKNLLPSPEA